MKAFRFLCMLIVVVTLLGVTLTACGGASTPAATETAAASTTTPEASPSTSQSGSTSGDSIKIGGIYNLTGGMSSIDVPTADAAKLAVKEINAAGGVLGKQIDFVVLDAKTDVTTSSNVATQLVEVEKVKAMTGLNDSTFAVAAGQVAQNGKVPYVVCGATTPQMPDMVGDDLFMMSFGDTVQGAAGAEFTYKNLGKKTVWVMFDKGMDYARGLSTYFKTRYEEMGGKVVGQDEYQTGDTDYSSQVTRLKAIKPLPEALYIAAGPDEIGTIVKQIREAGITLPIIGGDGFDTPLLIELGGKANTNDVYYTTHLGLANNSPKATAFKAAYKAEYGKELDSVFGAIGYDAVYLIADAIKRANSDDPEAIRKALAETKDFEGVTGKLSYPDNSRVPNVSVAVVQVVDGQVQFDAEVIPEKVPAP
jgi:branched-chain amino acid transport system substrate-binding protein